MANLASVKYIIEDSLDNLKMIKNATELSGLEIDTLIELGYSESELESKYLRGEIIYSYIEDDVLNIEAEECWNLTDFSELLQEKFPYSNIYYYIEEPGWGIYETNDSDGKYFPEKYVVEYYDGGDLEDTYYPESDEDLFELTSELTDGKVTDFASLDKFNEDEFNYFIVHNINVV